MLKNKKGVNIMDLQTLGIALVVVAVAVGLGAEVLGDIAESQCDNWTGTSCFASPGIIQDIDYNITIGGMQGLREVGDRLDTVGLIAVVSIILGIIMMYLGKRVQ